ncbi:MAG: helix-turn-helix domain-containing protein [Micromonosporaceae bacterium]|nr:helix-turn-helix domain-containing protein [Micromonosporaceae bacterium]
MARSWKDVKADKERRDRAAGRDVESARAAANEKTQAYVLGHRLAHLRVAAGLSQTALAKRMGVSQPRVSQLEQGDIGQMEIDTIRRYIAALGGHLRIVADFDDRNEVISTSQIDRGETNGQVKASVG